MLDKLIDSTQLNSALQSTANAFRTKTSTAESLAWNMDTGFKDAIDNIPAVEETVYHPASAYKTVTNTSPVLSINDGVANKPMEIKIQLNSIQDLHGYDYPWVGGAGNNLIPDGTDTSNGYIDGYRINMDGSTSSVTDYYVSEYFAVSPNTEYVLSNNYSGTLTNAAICFYDENKTYISGVKFDSQNNIQVTTPATATYARSSQSRLDYLIQFELGSTATTVLPYRNICPISGHTGCDVVDAPARYANADLTLSNGRIKDDGTFTTSSSYKHTQMIPVKQGDIIHVISKYSTDSGHYTGRCAYDSSMNPIASSIYVDTRGAGDKSFNFTVTMPENAAYWCMSGPVEEMVDGTVLIAINDTIKQITFTDSQGNPITVYGGELTINKDGTGRIKETVKQDLLKNFSWVFEAANNRFTCGTLSDILNMTARTMPIKSSCFQTISDGRSLANVPDHSIFNGTSTIYIRDTTAASGTGDYATNLVNLYGDEQIIYILATPVTYDLTASQVGQITSLLNINNIWSNETATAVLELIYASSTPETIVDQGSIAAGDQKLANIITSNILEDNIKTGVTIKVGDTTDDDSLENITGTFTSDGTATAADIVSDKIAYVNGEKITGAILIANGQSF